MEYRTLETEIIHNIHNVQFYELELDGKRLFSEFIEDLTDAKDKKTFIAIATIMDNFSFNQKLPDKLFKQIKSIGRKDVYEFKKANLRVYVIMQKPNMFIILGGYKTNQQKDIEKIDRYTKRLPELLTIQK
jgi:putative component of toxin-antitoxin plasmid stabilization module